MPEIIGTIKVIGEVQSFANNFHKRDLVIVTDEKYPQTIIIDFLADTGDLLDKFTEGEEVKVHINLRGRIWKSPKGEEKYFNSLVGWKVENLGSSKTSSKKNIEKQEKHAGDEFLGMGKEDFDNGEPDNLPF